MTTTTTPAELVERARLLDARLSVLDLYDAERGSLGHDYGNGQRFHELSRVRRERDEARRAARAYGVSDLELVATPEQVRAAFREISVERLRRYRTDAHRPSTADRAVRAWTAVGNALR
jgi:LmbE family N-acetylglucosaminyl deacetylase